MPTITSWFLTHKKLIINLSFLIQVLTITVLVTSFFMPEFRLWWREIGGKAGTLAILMLCITLAPGILKRFGVRGILQQFQIILMAVRRQTGQLMYTFAFAHWMWVKIFPALAYSGNLIAKDVFELMGMLALFLATPLMLTSNDKSLKLLKKGWNKLHKLVYLILLFVWIHLFLLTERESIFYILTLICLLEIVSAMISWQRKRFVV